MHDQVTEKIAHLFAFCTCFIACFIHLQITDMLSGPLEGCYSSLMHDEGKGLRGLVLTLVALKVRNFPFIVLPSMHPKNEIKKK